jgi:molybdopterin converting factor small subunit
MLKVFVRFLATVKDKVDRGAEEYELPNGSRLSELAVELEKRHQLSLQDPTIMVTLNGKGLPQLPDGMETKLCEGDTILLFPPISGG